MLVQKDDKEHHPYDLKQMDFFLPKQAQNLEAFDVLSLLTHQLFSPKHALTRKVQTIDSKPALSVKNVFGTKLTHEQSVVAA